MLINTTKWRDVQPAHAAFDSPLIRLYVSGSCHRHRGRAAEIVGKPSTCRWYTPLETNQTDLVSLQGWLPNILFSISAVFTPKGFVSAEYLALGAPFQTLFLSADPWSELYAKLSGCLRVSVKANHLPLWAIGIHRFASGETEMSFNLNCFNLAGLCFGPRIIILLCKIAHPLNSSHTEL